MPKIIKNSEIVEDTWHLIQDENTGIPESGHIIVPLTIWQKNKADLMNRETPIGVWLDSHEEPEAIADDLTHFSVIAIHFPKFTDGRGYSIARLLRERFSFQGELRAIGDVLQDQLFYLKRCGFDAFTLREDINIDKAVQSLNDFSVAYQTSYDEKKPLFRRRPS